MSPRRRIALAGAVASIAALGVYLAAAPPSAGPPAPAAPAEGPLSTSAERPEQPDLAGDFELLDPAAAPSAGLEGVVPSLSDLPVPLTQRTMRYVQHFATTEPGRKTFQERYRKASRYREHIERKLHDGNFPEDVLWLAAIESGFNPQATSPAGAVGLFQFMPETAARYGLAVGPDVDERRSITKGTDAALAYLAFLHEYTGRWDLALAAYNCGEDRVADAVDDARALLGRGPDEEVAFHELAELELLPRETAHFVPQIHAFAIVAHNRELLGLEDLDPLPPLRFAEIAVPPATRLATIAKAADVSIATLREYNPDLLTDRLPDGKGDVLVNIPSDSLAQALAALPAHLAREPASGSRAEAPSRKRRAALVDGSKKQAAPETPSGERAASATGEAPKQGLTPAPLRPGAFVLESGVFVEIAREASPTVEVAAKVDLVDPTRARAPLGVVLSLEPRRAEPGALREALADTNRDLRAVVLGDAAKKLREHVAARRKRFYDKTGFGGAFAALSERAFPEAHPMHGALLVGPTEPADDMFLEPEPAWALEATVTLRGPVDPDAVAEPLEDAFASAFVPARPPTAVASGRVALGDERSVLVGWATPPLAEDGAAAAHLAFVLACHNKMGRLHRALRHDRAVAGRVGCSLELAPQATVAWVLAMPAVPHDTTDAEKAIDQAIHALVTDGPTAAELTAAQGLLRAELARERETATLRGLPKSRVAAQNEKILAAMKGVERAEVVAAAKALFPSGRKIVVVGD